MLTQVNNPSPYKMPIYAAKVFHASMARRQLPVLPQTKSGTTRVSPNRYMASNKSLCIPHFRSKS